MYSSAHEIKKEEEKEEMGSCIHHVLLHVIDGKKGAHFKWQYYFFLSIEPIETFTRHIYSIIYVSTIFYIYHRKYLLIARIVFCNVFSKCRVSLYHSVLLKHHGITFVIVILYVVTIIDLFFFLHIKKDVVTLSKVSCCKKEKGYKKKKKITVISDLDPK